MRSRSVSRGCEKTVESDIVIVVEGFRKKDVDITRYSLSTKVADSLSSGVAVFAYGSRDCGAIEYAESVGCIVTCVEKNELEKSLRSLIFDPARQKENYEKSAEVVAKTTDWKRAPKYSSPSSTTCAEDNHAERKTYPCNKFMR